MSETDRLDVRLHQLYPDISRTQLQRFIISGLVSVNGDVVTKSRQLLHPEDKLKLAEEALDQPAEHIELPVIFEDEDSIVIDKPAGVLSHSKGEYNPEATVSSWLYDRIKGGLNKKQQTNANNRLGIVHRLDRGTSGVMILAKNEDAFAWLQKQFSTRKVGKKYTARVEGKIEPPQAKLDLPIERNPAKPQRFRVGRGGKSAQTEYKLLETLGYNQKTDSMVELQPLTGRTHQLRVHMKYIGYPIVGDTFYGGRDAMRMYLHANSLKIALPGGMQKEFKSRVPKEFYSLKEL